MEGEESVKSLVIKVLFLILIIAFLFLSVMYLNKRWGKIRDIRRQADAKSVIRALDFYNIQFGSYPETLDDDGDGWDKSNDTENRSFLEPIIKVGLLPTLVFDPTNDEEHYYRYQKFVAGDFGCRRPFAVFQVTGFESELNVKGNGECPDLDWTSLVPNGFTWFSFE